jgi:hypothetical protein
MHVCVCHRSYGAATETSGKVEISFDAQVGMRQDVHAYMAPAGTHTCMVLQHQQLSSARAVFAPFHQGGVLPTGIQTLAQTASHPHMIAFHPVNIVHKVHHTPAKPTAAHPDNSHIRLVCAPCIHVTMSPLC